MDTVITITKMNLARNRFTHFPPDILKVSLPQLRAIDLSENRLGDRTGVSVSVFGEVSSTLVLIYFSSFPRHVEFLCPHN
jgi:hypothetical protein